MQFELTYYISLIVLSFSDIFSAAFVDHCHPFPSPWLKKILAPISKILILAKLLEEAAMNLLNPTGDLY
jgi:hypothetical protein